MSADSLHFIFDELSKPVRLIDCSDLVDYFPLIFPGWQIIETPAGNKSPILTLSKDQNGYTLEGYWLDKPIYRTDKVAALCALVAELIRAYVHDDNQLLCLHGAAVELGGKLVIFPSKYRAGKSILAACLAAAGIPLFCDDVLPINLVDGSGIAPGLAPRLRLPLPDNLRPESRQFIGGHSTLQGKRYLYLELQDGLLAPRGQRAAVGAFVLLEREPGVSPVFEDISEAEVLQKAIWQNFAREAEAPKILEVLSRLVADSKRFRLRYDKAEDAVDLLIDKFSHWPSTDAAGKDEKTMPRGQLSVEIDLSPGCYLRKADISMVQVDDQSFLADGQGATIHQLNSVGSAIWSLLSEPITLEEVTAILLTAFPEMESAQVETDLSSLIDELMAKNLLRYGI